MEIDPNMQYFCHAFTMAASSLKFRIKYAKTLLCKAGFSFPGADMFVSPCFVRSVTTFNANVKEFRSITVLFEKSPYVYY